jgi:hypothetical protein
MFLDDTYPYSTNKSFLDYEFNSWGGKGVIKKVARFTQIVGMGSDIYNFGFGDLDEKTGEISDTIVSNNGDAEKVLRTVAVIITDFAAVYPDASIFIQGTTPSRTRRYQIGINRFWTDIGVDFKVWGLKEGRWCIFRPGENYEAFIAKRSI